MNKKDLEIGNDLLKLINITEKNLEKLNHWIDNSQYALGGSLYKTDANYNLCICKHTDGSGNSIDLSRYFGNTKILHLIQKELESQLKEFKEDFENL